VQLQYLKRQGVSGIVNLCREFEDLVDEDLLQALGFRYLHVAVTDMHAPTHQQLDHVLEWIEQHQAASCEEQEEGGTGVVGGEHQGASREGFEEEIMEQQRKQQGETQEGVEKQEEQEQQEGKTREWVEKQQQQGNSQGGVEKQKQQNQSQKLGKGVVVHCYAGQGRTGTVLAAWLMVQALKGKGGVGVGTLPLPLLATTQEQQEKQETLAGASLGVVATAYTQEQQQLGTGGVAAASTGAGPCRLPLTATQAIARVRLLLPSSVESYLQEKALGEYQQHLQQKWAQLQQSGGGAGGLEGGFSLARAQRVAEALEDAEAREEAEGVVNVLQQEVEAGHVLPV
jgi:hypothetical protein